MAAIPSAVLWARPARRFSRPGALAWALLLQAAGVALPALTGSTTAALASAALFGATFVGISQLALATGTELRFRRSVAVLTAGYSLGQILGPLVATPLLHHGYRQALLLAAAVITAAAAAAALLWAGRRSRQAPESAGVGAAWSDVRAAPPPPP